MFFRLFDRRPVEYPRESAAWGVPVLAVREKVPGVRRYPRFDASPRHGLEFGDRCIVSAPPARRGHIMVGFDCSKPTDVASAAFSVPNTPVRGLPPPLLLSAVSSGLRR